MRDLIVLGGGPGGYSAALRAAQLGMKVTLVEKKRVGGVCLNEGCIPTKALLHAGGSLLSLKKGDEFGLVVGNFGLDWKKVQGYVKNSVEKLVGGVEYLLERSGVEVIIGEGRLISQGRVEVQGEVLEAKWVILATGTRPAELPFLPFGERVLTSSELLFFHRIPQRLLVIGAGAIGLEMATAFSLFGAEVTVVEALPTPLGGAMDRDMASFLIRALKELGIEVLTSSAVERAEVGKDGVRLWLKGGKLLEGEYVLVAVGRKPNSEVLRGVVELDEKGFVKTAWNLRTSLEGTYAIGDLAGPPLLAHKAHHEGVFVVESLAGREGHRPELIPMAVFTEPEFSSVGLTETEAKRRGIFFKKARFPMGANGRAVTVGETSGMVKILAGEDGRLLGVQILGPGASEIINEAALAVKEGLKASELAASVHVHPTVSEALMEAAMALEGKAIHVLNR